MFGQIGIVSNPKDNERHRLKENAPVKRLSCHKPEGPTGFFPSAAVRLCQVKEEPPLWQDKLSQPNRESVRSSEQLNQDYIIRFFQNAECNRHAKYPS